MVSKISEGVEISVESFYQSDYSNPANSEYMFAYRITIENHNNFSVKLLRRTWKIFDSNKRIFIRFERDFSYCSGLSFIVVVMYQHSKTWHIHKFWRSHAIKSLLLPNNQITVAELEVKSS